MNKKSTTEEHNDQLSKMLENGQKALTERVRRGLEKEGMQKHVDKFEKLHNNETSREK